MACDDEIIPLKERIAAVFDIDGLYILVASPYHWVERCSMVSKAKSAAQATRGRELIEWAARRALPSGVMAEQLHPYTGEPISVSPLTWSHAAYVRAVREYSDRVVRMQLCPTCGQPMKRAARLTEKLQIVTPGRAGSEARS